MAGARMPWDIAIGCAAAGASLLALLALVLWSRRRIERIAARGYGTARQIEKDENGRR